jgi:hypothetical protein
MWKKIYEIIKDIFLLQRETQQNKEDIKELRNEVKQVRDEMQKLILIVQKLSFDIQDIRNREESEREKLALRLENEMLKFERRLPQGKDLEK